MQALRRTVVVMPLPLLEATLLLVRFPEQQYLRLY
jgi:hypothetical protein